MNLSIFRAYDIRGVYPTEINESDVSAIASALALVMKEKKQGGATRIGVGKDNRCSSPALWDAVAAAIRNQGVDVVDIGYASSPFFYFAVKYLGLDAGVQITASHNPPQYNGLKFANPAGLPLDDAEIERIKTLSAGPSLPPVVALGSLSSADVTGDYIAANLALVPLRNGAQSARVVVDPGNGVSGLMCRAFFDEIKGDMVPLFFEMDGSFPNRAPNPLIEENIRTLENTVRETSAAFGVALDADGDRIVCVDENGRCIAPELLTALLSQELIAMHPGVKIVFDLRSSHIIPETITRCGGTPLVSPVGHTFIKKLMQKEDALFAGELSGHYYFRDIGYFEAPLLVITLVINMLSASGKPLSELIAPFRKYPKIEETNFEVADKQQAIERLQTTFSDAHISLLDGITIEYPDWWCNVRPSNTENLLRLNLEAQTEELLNTKLTSVKEVIVGVHTV